MQLALSLAVTRLGLTPEQAIVAATVNAAHTLGCAASIGTLETGKRADIIIMNTADYHEISSQFGVNNVLMVFREGHIVFNRTRWKAAAN
jgi:imidazolonepropionase